ncbi:FAD dependent oxidoreductase-domain-containing protein [Talaromyces proteolyticus]|uniref:FAD dependent oxidoreductase-domain-containing protein n=1 Tax=Talaromyces proteolyticus TaxID=1131652 RepID=A0AAD4KYB6_9EURO|nr:FAD dependent oxidoreductase-domain-containing protein [Talaromyces proteolyticus]KAH8703796.1 FAD dependent oxidoreductase-domain-containing protein [Talaromyces proteolyticus]
MNGFTGENRLYDLIILGATPGGISAAISAARLGKNSLILERTRFIGGLPANGLGATDIATRGATGGIFFEFIQRIKQKYVDRFGSESKEVEDCSDGYRFEPSVAEVVFTEMLEGYKTKVDVLKERQFDFQPWDLRMAKDGTKIQAIHVTNLKSGVRETYRALFFVDATYEGDLIAAAGVPCYIGRESRSEYGELGAGKVYKLWRGPECVGTDYTGDNAVQAYNYRLCLTDNPYNRVSIQKPAHYNRDEYVSLIQDVKTGAHTSMDSLEISQKQLEENARRAEKNLPPEPDYIPGIQRLSSICKLPLDKWDGNNMHFAFISTDLPEENWPYPTASWEWRDKFAIRLREYTEGLFYFAQNDPELPLYFREKCKEWGWAKDEYVENGHFPRQIYVREGRRMKGKYLFTAHDSLPTTYNGRPPVHYDSITASHYQLDSHAVRKREAGRVHLDGFLGYPCAPYTVPYRVMIPDSPVGNLIAPVPVSATHIGFSTLRMEPCWMALGQAAGIAASLCIDEKIVAGDVSIGQLQDALLNEGAILVYQAGLLESWKEGNRQEFAQTQKKELQMNGINVRAFGYRQK